MPSDYPTDSIQKFQGLTLNNPSEWEDEEDIEAGRQRVLTAYKRRKLLEDGRTPVEKYIDVFWRKDIILRKIDQ